MAADTEKLFSHDRYLCFQEITEVLEEAARRYPDRCRLTSLGRTPEGREIWCAVLSAGSDEDKPALYVDGNHHAGEVTGSMACLRIIERLLGGADEERQLLHKVTVYVVPRVSPDGAERYLTTPHLLRSVPRPYPEVGEPEGFQEEDVDGDGRILWMRIPDPAGEWRVSEKDPRVMVRRRPGESGGQYYRLLREGRFHRFDGLAQPRGKPRWGLDLNRNYPARWATESKQRGAGPMPLSEPEVRAVSDFLASHPNVAAAVSFHTSGGFLLSPPCTYSFDKLDRRDAELYRIIGREGKRLTGYDHQPVFDGFTADRDRPHRGSFLDFAYELLGVICFAPELWDLRTRAGLPRRLPREWQTVGEEEREREEVELLKWCDRELGGRGFVPWYPITHPQLGAVELGGWDVKALTYNPPPNLLPEELDRAADFALLLARCLPQLDLGLLEPEPLGPAEQGGYLYRVRAWVENHGLLPTGGSYRAEQVGHLEPLRMGLCVPEGVRVVAGEPVLELEHLPGRHLPPGAFGGGTSPLDHRRVGEWVVAAARGAEVRIWARAPRAGSVERRVVLR